MFLRRPPRSSLVSRRAQSRAVHSGIPHSNSKKVSSEVTVSVKFKFGITVGVFLSREWRQYEIYYLFYYLTD